MAGVRFGLPPVVREDLSYFVFFKQKTAYEVTVSSDVCSSDLVLLPRWNVPSYPEVKTIASTMAVATSIEQGSDRKSVV